MLTCCHYSISSKGVISPEVCINSVTVRPALCLHHFYEQKLHRTAASFPPSLPQTLTLLCTEVKTPFALDKGLLPAQSIVTEEGTETYNLTFRRDFSSGCHTGDSCVGNPEKQPWGKPRLNSCPGEGRRPQMCVQTTEHRVSLLQVLAQAYTLARDVWFTSSATPHLANALKPVLGSYCTCGILTISWYLTNTKRSYWGLSCMDLDSHGTC